MSDQDGGKERAGYELTLAFLVMFIWCVNCWVWLLSRWGVILAG